MINSQMQPYKLYVNEPVYDITNHIIDNYVDVQDVLVAVNFITMNRVSNDIRYKDCQYTGLTTHKEFEQKKDYKLVDVTEGAKKEYLIKSINQVTKLTQLLLQEVI